MPVAPMQPGPALMRGGQPTEADLRALLTSRTDLTALSPVDRQRVGEALMQAPVDPFVLARPGIQARDPSFGQNIAGALRSVGFPGFSANRIGGRLDAGAVLAGDVGRFAAEMAPGTGEVLSAAEARESGQRAVNAFRRQKLSEAALEAGLTGLNLAGAIPIVGAGARAAKKAGETLIEGATPAARGAGDVLTSAPRRDFSSVFADNAPLKTADPSIDARIRSDVSGVTVNVKKAGGEAGDFRLEANPAEGEVSFSRSNVLNKFQRQGIARSVYGAVRERAERAGLSLVPSDTISLTDDAFEFWLSFDPQQLLRSLKKEQDQLGVPPTEAAKFEARMTRAEGAATDVLSDAELSRYVTIEDRLAEISNELTFSSMERQSARLDAELGPDTATSGLLDAFVPGRVSRRVRDAEKAFDERFSALTDERRRLEAEQDQLLAGRRRP